MIPPNLGDLSAAARALMCAPPAERRDLMHRLLSEARRRKPTTTLMAVALNCPTAPEPSLQDRLFLRCLHIGIEALIECSSDPIPQVFSPKISPPEAPTPPPCATAHLRDQTGHKRVRSPASG